MSASPQLWIPKVTRAPKPNGEDGKKRVLSPAEFAQQQQRRRAYIKSQEFAGRSNGKPHGTYVTDEAEQRKCVILCSACNHKFDPRRYQYYLTREFRVQGRCDACKEHVMDVNFYIHESLLGRKHGQCWTPR